MARFSIRSCREGDLPAVQAIYADAVLNGTASFETAPPDLAEMTRRWRALREGGFPYLVAVDEETVLGYAYAGPYRPRRAYRATVENSVYVAATARGLGVGRALLADLVAAATQRGFRQMIAVIGDSANAASIALHRGAGFAHVGTFRAVGWKHGRWLDSVLMQRALGAGDAEPLADGADSA
ncbi:MAG: N-acetyltransferase family protein [Alphaproteobacteria bacterium]|nr:MAG: N-acetyltransferase family protein [Alphaproteobacteria bacterium]